MADVLRAGAVVQVERLRIVPVDLWALVRVAALHHVVAIGAFALQASPPRAGSPLATLHFLRANVLRLRPPPALTLVELLQARKGCREVLPQVQAECSAAQQALPGAEREGGEPSHGAWKKFTHNGT